MMLARACIKVMFKSVIFNMISSAKWRKGKWFRRQQLLWCIVFNSLDVNLINSLDVNLINTVVWMLIVLIVWMLILLIVWMLILLIVWMLILLIVWMLILLIVWMLILLIVWMLILLKWGHSCMCFVDSISSFVKIHYIDFNTNVVFLLMKACWNQTICSLFVLCSYVASIKDARKCFTRLQGID
jgi:hypothetical protein